MSTPQDALRGHEPLNSIHRVGLDPAVSARLFDVALTMPEAVYSRGFMERYGAMEVANQAAEVLTSSPIGAEIKALRDGRQVALVVSGLPIDLDLPMPPRDGDTPVGKTTFVSETVGLGLASVVGAPSAIMGEKHEALVHQVTPVAGREETQSNEGQVALKLHQDLAPSPTRLSSTPYGLFMPDYLVLTGVKSDATESYIAELDPALAQLSDRQIAILGERRFVTGPPASFVKGMEGSVPTPPAHLVVELNEGHFESTFDSSSGLRVIDEADHEAQEALASLGRALDSVKQRVAIEPGTAAVFNNRRVAHGRGRINDSRWIQRVYSFDTARVSRESLSNPIRGSLSILPGFVGVLDSQATDARLWSSRALSQAR